MRWNQFGAFSPIFRTHGCRLGPSEPDTDKCKPAQNSCGFNEIWSYGNDTETLLVKMVEFLSRVLKPYIQALDASVTKFGVPTMRPLAYEFPSTRAAAASMTSTCLGRSTSSRPSRRRTRRRGRLSFPAGADWRDVWSGEVVKSGQAMTVKAPLDVIPAYERQPEGLSQISIENLHQIFVYVREEII